MKHVIFPGTPGNYLSTPDVNLLDANTAHLEQSIGGWQDATYATWLTEPVLDPASMFGSKVQVYTLTAQDGTSFVFVDVRPSAYIGSQPVGTKLQVGIWVIGRNLGARTVRVMATIYFRNAGGGYVNQESGAPVELVEGVPSFIFHSRIVQDASHTYSFGWNLTPGDGAILGTEEVRVSAAVFRLGDDASFVPSLRIAGDLEAEAKVKVPAHTGDWRSFISTAYNEDGFMLRQEQSSPVAGLLHADGTWRGGESSTQIPADQWTTIRGRADLGVEFSFLFNNVPAGSDSINSNPGLPSGKDLTIGTWLSSSGPDQDFVGSMSHALARDGIDGPIVASFDAEDINV